MIIRPYIEQDGIKVFHAAVCENHLDYNAKGLDNLFLEEETHFWFLARKQFIAQQIKKKIDDNEKLIEIGAGTGNVARYLKDQGYTNIAVGEMHKKGLYYAKTYGIKDCYQFDLLESPFEEEFDVVCMFDVLEHIEHDTKALVSVHEMLKKRGRVVLTVPAHQWLWNCDDDIAGHKRRYSKKELVEKLKGTGFDIEIARYFFISIVPLLWLRKVRDKEKRRVQIMEKEGSGIAISPVLNKLLYGMLWFENKVNDYIPNWFGGSLLVIARKNDSL